MALLDLNVGGAEQLATEISSAGCVAQAFGRDVALEGSVEDAAKAKSEAMGPRGVLVNKVLPLSGGLECVAFSEWNTMLAIDLSVYLLRARDMLDARKGSVCHVASTSDRNTPTCSGAYSPS